MSYTPTTWVTGNKVTATKLNKIETELVALDTDKANIDGYYESMTVGNAEQLVATVGVEDSVPFNFRTTGGSADVGDRKTMELVGGTVAWNQLIVDGDFPDNSTKWASSGVGSTISIQNGTCKLTSGSSSYAGIYNDRTNIKAQLGRKYLICATMKSNTTLTNTCDISIHVGNYQQNSNFSLPENVETSVCKIISINSFAADGTENMQFQIWTPHSGSTSGIEVEFKNVVAFDLTQMFGSTIADHIYSLEQANAGAGVAWFRKLFPKSYYAYNAGELMSVKTSAYKAVGFNQWDEEWELGSYNTGTGKKVENPTTIRNKNPIPALPQTQYFAPLTVYNMFCYDADNNYLGTALYAYVTIGYVWTTLPNTRYISFRTDNAKYGTTYNHDICINLHWDGERDGEYEPYETHTYELDSDLELRGIPKLDADNQLYYDGDIYESDGDVRRRFGVVDLGTLNWDYNSSSGHERFTSQLPLPGAKTAGGSIIPNAFSPQFDLTSSNGVYVHAKDNTFSLTGEGRAEIYASAYTDAATFKAAMSGVYLLYELAIPEEETADPFQTPQIVNDFGTEEFVDSRTIPIPVGHNSKYQANLRAKLEMAPNSPSGDGDYIVRQAGGQNTYVPITFPADELPAAPTTDGNYVLKCTVSSGTATFTWEAQT